MSEQPAVIRGAQKAKGMLCSVARAVVKYSCRLEWDAEEWRLRHLPDYLPIRRYVPWSRSLEQIEADAEQMHQRYRADFEADDPALDPLRNVSTDHWCAKWFPHSVLFFPPLTMPQTNMLTSRCAMVGPLGYAFLGTRTKFVFRKQEDASACAFPYVVDFGEEVDYGVVDCMTKWCMERFNQEEGADTYFTSKRKFYFRDLQHSIMFRLALSEWV